jgi:hypothetical protein
MIKQQNLKLAILKKLQNYCKYLNISQYGKKIDVIERIYKTLIVRKMKFNYFKKKGHVCTVCLEELYPPIQNVFPNNRFHSQCLIACINATGKFVEPIYKNKLTTQCLESLRTQCYFLKEKFVNINLERIVGEEKKSEEEHALLQAIYCTITEYEASRALHSIQELQIFLQFFFSLNPTYSVFIMKNLIEMKKDDLHFQNFLISILHRFEANLTESEEQFEKTRKNYKSLYCDLQQQSFLPPSLMETNVFENLLFAMQRSRTRNPQIRRMEGGPQTRSRHRRANHAFLMI